MMSEDLELRVQLTNARRTLRATALGVVGLSVMLFTVAAVLFGASLTTIASGVLASLVASVIFYLVFQLALEGPTAALVATEASDAAVKNVLVRFASVPAQVYPESDVPVAAFQRQFHAMLRESNHYWLKGTSATFATSRLEKARGDGTFRGKQIRMLLLDPEANDLLLAYSRLQLDNTGGEYDAERVRTRAMDLQTLILTNLDKMSRVAQQLDLEVRLHRSFPFFRSEIFVTGLLVSYHDSGKRYPASLFYPSTSGASHEPRNAIYAAFQIDFMHCFNTGTQVVAPTLPPDTLQALFARCKFKPTTASTQESK